MSVMWEALFEAVVALAVLLLAAAVLLPLMVWICIALLRMLGLVL